MKEPSKWLGRIALAGMILLILVIAAYSVWREILVLQFLRK